MIKKEKDATSKSADIHISIIYHKSCLAIGKPKCDDYGHDHVCESFANLLIEDGGQNYVGPI